MNIESQEILDDKTKREILKHIKKNQVFGKFYMCCAEAFHRNSHPRDSLNSYLTYTVKDYLVQGRMEDFISSMKSWPSVESKTLIMP